MTLLDVQYLRVLSGLIFNGKGARDIEEKLDTNTW